MTSERQRPVPAAEHPVAGSGSGPRPPRPDAATRVLDAALRLVAERGLTVGLDRISLEEAVAASGVSRATAYRRWPAKQAFHRDVLLGVVRSARVEPEDDEDLDVLRGLVTTYQDVLGTAAGWRTFVVECFRVTADSDVRRLAGSRAWRDHLALRATCASLDDHALRDAVHAELAAAERRASERRARVYARLPGLLGYRLVPWLDEETGFLLMADAVGALMTGLAARAGVVAERPTRLLRAFGSTVEAPWTTEAYALVATLLAYLQPDPAVPWDAGRAAAALARAPELEAEVLRLRRED